MGCIRKYVDYLISIGAIYDFDPYADNTSFLLKPEGMSTPKTINPKNESSFNVYNYLSPKEYLDFINSNQKEKEKKELQIKKHLLLEERKLSKLKQFEDEVFGKTVRPGDLNMQNPTEPAVPNSLDTILDYSQKPEEQIKNVQKNVQENIPENEKEKAKKILDLIRERNRTVKNYWEA